MVRLSEMDSGSIVFAGRTGRGGKTAGGWVLRGGRGAGQSRRDERQRRCRGGRMESGDGRDGGEGEGVVAMAGERPAFLREIFLRRVAESGR